MQLIHIYINLILIFAVVAKKISSYTVAFYIFLHREKHIHVSLQIFYFTIYCYATFMIQNYNFKFKKSSLCNDAAIGVY